MTTCCAASETVGLIRVQSLGPYLFRLEQKGPRGFEDRNTFTIPDRPDESGEFMVMEDSNEVVLATDTCRIRIPTDTDSLNGIRIESPDRRLLHRIGPDDGKHAFLPAPSSLPDVWIMPDTPRLVPPEWGALPPPAGRDDPFSGWSVNNQAPDLYVFLPRAAGYETFRADFLQLTGRVPMIPLYAFGLWYSRYHPYSEKTALAVIDRFRANGLPLDVFVADTDWRVGASCGYAVNTNLFPDMKRFLRRAHAKHVRVMFNDHPEPVGQRALAPRELAFRQAGLTGLTHMGVDVWWYDRNWHTHLQTPAEGLPKEVWGMRLYHDITQDARPTQRPLIMSNADGINNGKMETASHPAAHRYPIWWTGDTIAEWDYLRRGVQNGVDSGIVSLLPYVHEDLTGHHGQPEAEYYVRFMQFGLFSPIARIHSSAGTSRYPWQYGPETEQTVGDYIRLRYRLLPTIYSAAYAAHRDGTPLMRRCDLEWPWHPKACDPTQYLFGDDLLVAPILEAGDEHQVAQRTVWIPEGDWEDVWTGEIHSGPGDITVRTPLERMPLFVRRGGMIVTGPQIDFTKDAGWPRLTVHAYVPTNDGTTIRQLYEDDGLTTDYLTGAFGLTHLTLEKTGRTIRLTITPDAEHRTYPAVVRDWTLRFSLPDDTTLHAVSVDGLPVEPARIVRLPKSSDPIPVPFPEKDAGAGPKGGAWYEIQIKGMNADRTATVQFECGE